MKISTAILLYKFTNNTFQVFLVHPGGPFWGKKDLGAWSIPKGEIENDELRITNYKLLENAIRELKEETGITISEHRNFIELGQVKMKSGKVIYAWAYEYDKDILSIASNTTLIEWPPKSGKKLEIPEVDKGEWFGVEIAKEKVNPAQVIFLERLIELVASYK
jgi:predicted NUDIX family NTP pyrophosphohydrolase